MDRLPIPRLTYLITLLAALWIAACQPAATSSSSVETSPAPATQSTVKPTPTVRPLPTQRSAQPPSTHIPTATATATLPPPVWENVAPGFSQTTLYAPVPDEDIEVPVLAVRIDPALVNFQVFYDAEEPRNLDDWRVLAGADLVVNGGFFSGDNRPVGRLIIDGVLYGAAFGTEGRIGTPGLFAVLDDQASIFALGYGNYTPRGLRFDQAIEAYPVLLLPGRTVFYPEPPADDPGRRARRTVIGIDPDGQVVILVVDYAIFTLHELALWLASSNLTLDMALNLDGGRSSGLVFQAGGITEIIPSYVPLPIVLAVSERRITSP